MQRFTSAALSILVAFGVMLSLTTAASANPIAGGGYSSSYAGESVFTQNQVGETGQMSAIFFNDGSQAWSPGVVGLLVCAADKVTCNVSANGTFAKNWFSPTVYATVTTTVGAGQNGFFVYDFTVPAGTPNGTVTTFYGDVGLIATGAEFRPQGYFQINTTPIPTITLSLGATGCAKTLIDPSVTTAPAVATTTTLPTGTPAELLPRLLVEAGKLSDAIGNNDHKGEQITIVNDYWNAVRPALAKADGVLVLQFDPVIALCQRGEKYNRPADADKCFRNLTTLADAFLAKYP